MSTFRFLHLADVHLDTTFLCRSESLRSRLRQALRTAFARAVDCAITEEVDAVLIAGDLFDDHRLSFTTERFLLEQCRRLHEAGVSCYYATGNHDPGGKTFRGSRLEWPSTFHYIKSAEPQYFDVLSRSAEPVGRIVAAGHTSGRVETNLARTFPRTDTALPHVGLLHTYVASAAQVEAHDRYAPCVLDDLRRPGYRYWALGHIHVRQQVCSESQAWYSGNLQGRNPRETGGKGGLLVSLHSSGAADVEFRSFAPLEWVEISLDDLREAHTLEDLVSRARQAFDRIRERSRAEDWVLRMKLEGSTPLADVLRQPDQIKELEEELLRNLDLADIEVRLDRLHKQVELDDYREQPHVLGEVLALLKEAEEDPEVLMDLMPNALARRCSDDGDICGYLQSLLHGLDVEAAERLAMSG